MYVIEFLMKKNVGNFNGWLSDTLAKNTRKFENNILLLFRL